MVIIDKVSGRPWNKANAALKSRSIRAQVVSELRKRDTERGIPENGQVYREEVTTVKKNGQEEVVKRVCIVDPILAALRHKPEEVDTLHRLRWLEFASEPQDETAFIDSVNKTALAAEKNRLKKKADELGLIDGQLRERSRLAKQVREQ